MELTQDHYRRAAIAYNAYCKQTGGKSLVSGDKLPVFDSLRQEIKDAWAAAVIAVSLDADRAIRSLESRAAFGDQCYQDRCENAYVEQTVVKRLERRIAELEATSDADLRTRMYVWTDRFSYLAVAHARSIAEARELMLVEMGESGDGSCPERDKARREILSDTPSIWMGPNAEFALSDSAEVREQEAHSERLQRRIAELEAQLSQVHGLPEATNSQERTA